MVALVLHDARVESAHRAIDRTALCVHAAIAQSLVTRDETPHARHGKTTFPTFFRLVVHHDELWIDEHRLRHRFRFRITRVRLHAEYRHLQPDTDLRRGQPCAIERRHRVLHVGDQAMEFGSIQLRHGLRRFEKTRVAHPKHGSNRHSTPPVDR